MYDRILIPLSFDEDKNTDDVLRAAAALAHAETVVTLLHVMAPIPKYASSYLPAGYRHDAQDTIEAAMTDMARGLPNAKGIVLEGQPGRSILNWAKEHNVDCIVMASHRAGPQEELLGSTAAQVLRHGRCAVHLVR
ncbi:universal stress protein [Cognatishimia sp. SS12]|uniref:universal stress protein n=1 Tax=Cognatishimia sp. SS12 TaxID=2979465 RepID=UPI00232F3B3E|nr:universal stress protein [Cognatishimia sp. SS12]MDC0738137.1 universal stress protein [Cognatishimia sp. SS12]